MNCPKCTYPNPQGVTYCQMCYEVFNRSAADRYLHAQRRARRDEMRETGEARSEAPPASSPDFSAPLMNGVRIVSESLSRLDWRTHLSRRWSDARVAAKKYLKELSWAALIIALGVGVLTLTSPSKRLQLLGGHLNYRFSPKAPRLYLITFGTEFKSWSERGGRLDTPLTSGEHSEIGNVFLKPAVRKKNQDVILEAKEWIVTQSGLMPQNIPLNHPSLKPLKITLDPNGDILHTDPASSSRLGRAMTFITPRFPVETLRGGAAWYEPVSWVQGVGDWKILWRGQIRWRLVDYLPMEHTTAAHLTYRAEVTPSIWEAPAWAKQGVSRVSYSGNSDGDAYFDMHKHQLLSNSFTQEGTVTMAIDNIYRIPSDQRVGRMPRTRWGKSVQAEPGRIILQLKEKLDVHKREAVK